MRLARAAACLLVVAGGLSVPGVSRADAAGSCATAEISSASQPACWRPFTAGSPFNDELPAYPALAPNSAAVQQHMATYGWSLDGSNGGFTLSGHGTRPVYFASPSDPVVSVRCTNEDGPGTCRGANRVDVNGAQINVPAGAAPDGNWDAHMTVIETATGIEYDFWHASISGSTLTAGAGSETDLAGDGTGGQGDAAHFALTAGLLRPSELASGEIDHALVITVPCTNATGANVGYTYPATGGWGEYCGQYWNESAADAPMLGQRFVLEMTDAQIAASGAPAWEQTIMTALAHYGAYIEDTNGSWRDDAMHIITQDPASWTDVGQANQWTSVIGQLSGGNSTLSSRIPIPTNRLQLVNTCVTQGTCPGASGTPPSEPPPPATPAPAAPSAPTISISSAGLGTAQPGQPVRATAPAPSGSRPTAAAGTTRAARRSTRHRHHSVRVRRRPSRKLVNAWRRSGRASRHARRGDRRAAARRARSHR